MSGIFEALFGDHSGQLFTANLHAAARENVLKRKIIREFAQLLNELASSNSGKPAKRIAVSAVFGRSEIFQRAGPGIRSPRTNLINIRELSGVHCSLTGQYPPPSDRMLMLAEVRAIIQARPEAIFGRADRLLWIAEKDEEVKSDVDCLLTREKDQSADGARRLEHVMLYYGLPIYARTNYLVTEFSFENWGSQPSDATYRRPTAFDGIVGDYFKQRRMCECLEHAEWNKTADLLSILRAEPRLGDGAWEAVGVPLQMTRIKRIALVLSSAEVRPCDPKTYVDHVKKAYVLAGVDWDSIPAEVAAMTGDMTPDDDED